MYLQSLKLFHFRNYDNLEIKFNKNLNIIYGKNGSGKTNIVEAIYVLALTRSFRNVNDKILIKKDYDITKVEGNIYFPGNNLENYKVIITKEGKKVKINQNKITKLSEYITKIPIVVFHPDDLKIIKDTPSCRRKQLNISISQYNLNYLKNLSVYNKILKQRNSYLKKMIINANKDNEYLLLLTEKLINVGLKIYSERKNFINQINKIIGNIYEKITMNSNIEIIYKSDYDNLTEQQIKDLYNKMLKKDLTLGKTNFGIHTDDIQFVLNGLDLKDYGSEGQQKNAVISYKFCELEILYEKLKVYPLLILDDIFSELDEEKIKNIFLILNNNIQTFITTTDLKLIDIQNFDNYKKFCVSSGILKEEEEYER